MRAYISILALAFLPALAQGQATTVPDKSWQAPFFDSATIALPILMTAAIKHSAQLKSLDIDKSISEQDVKIAKKRILESMTAGGSYTYGNLSSVGTSNPTNPNPNQLTTNNSGRYSAGVILALPLGQVATRGNIIKKEELNYQRSEAQRQEGENQLRQQVIQLYQNVLLARKVLNLQQGIFVTIQTNYGLIEKQFRQGQQSLSELSTASNQLAQTAIAQESARSNYNTAFMLLEEIVGAKISSLMPSR